MRRLLAAALAATVLALGGVAPVAGADEPSATTTSSSAVSAVPLVVILDISGSMAESVNSVVKLQAAKDSLEPVIRSFAGSGNVGIWTYPTASECGAGEYLVNVGDTASAATVLSRLDGTEAGGSTPTSAAITAVKDNLTGRGINEANLLLVSDGESNCGDIPPCEVAAGLAATGFDITIQAVGFDISDAGRAELECIAAATGGRYYNAADGDELQQVISELGVPQVQVSVAASDTPRAGEPTTITATVTNPSASEATDVRINLSFADAGPRTIFPAVVPPTIRIGNLPPGATATRSWSIVAGVRGEISDAAYTVSAWSRGNAAAIVQRSFTTTIASYTASDLGPLFSGVLDEDRSLVIMGDSYSSGEGTGSYLGGSADAVDNCHRSSQTYLVPILDAAKVPVDILACSGAVTGDFTRPATGDWLVRRATSQLSQLGGLDRVPGAVVMTAGGNDIGFAGIMERCLTGICNVDVRWIASRFEAIAGMEKPLTETYTAVWKTLNSSERVEQRGGDFAPVIVLAYPQIMHNSRYGACGNLLNSEEVRLANAFLAALNSRVSASVAAARAQGYEVYFVETTQTTMLPGHTVCAEPQARWVNGLTGAVALPPVASESYHPNTAGYEAITTAIVEWSMSVERTAPSPERMKNLLGPPPPAVVAPAIKGIEDLLLPDASVNYETKQGTTTQRGGVVALHASGYLPGESVTVQLQSNPLTLATLVADENGAVDGSVLVPEYADIGSHHLVLAGISSEGDFLEQSVALSVTPPTPVWVLLLVPVSVFFALAAATLFMIAGRRAKVAVES